MGSDVRRRSPRGKAKPGDLSKASAQPRGAGLAENHDRSFDIGVTDVEMSDSSEALTLNAGDADSPSLEGILKNNGVILGGDFEENHIGPERDLFYYQR